MKLRRSEVVRFYAVLATNRGRQSLQVLHVGRALVGQHQVPQLNRLLPLHLLHKALG